MPRIRLNLLVCMLILTGAANVDHLIAAAGETLTVKGYYFEISADRLGGALCVRGSISGGQSCQKLVADIYLYSEEGAREHLVIIVNDYGSNARFDAKERRIGKGRRWKVSKIKVRTYQ